MGRLFCVLLALLVAAGPVVGAVSAAGAPPMGPGGEPAPSPPPGPGDPTGTPAPPATTPSPPSTPAPPNAPPATPPNATGNTTTGGGGPGNPVGVAISWLVGGSAGGSARTHGSSLIQQLAYLLVVAAAFTPAPNNMENAFFNPSNGLWDGRWDYLQETVMPLFWASAVILFALTLLDNAFGLLSEEESLSWWSYFRGVFEGLMAPTIAGIWLNARQGLTLILLQDMTVSSIEAQLTAGVVLAAVVILIITDAWAMATLVLVIGGVVILIPAAYPWLGVLFLFRRASPFYLPRLLSNLLLAAYFVLSLLTLPIALFIGFGFSVDIAPTVTGAMVALDTGQYDQLMTDAVTSMFLFVAKFGSIAVGVLLAHKMLNVLDTLTPGLNLTPRKESVREAAHTARSRAGTARERAGKPVDAARSGVERAREADVKGRAQSVRSRVSSRLRADGGTPQDRDYQPPRESGEGSRWLLKNQRQRAEDRRQAREQIRDEWDDN